MRLLRNPVGKPLALVLAITAATAGLAVPATAAPPGVVPSTVDVVLTPGGSTTITKAVTTPTIPFNPDVVFLADTTGSMGAAIANVRSNIGSITGTVLAEQPTARFGVAEFKDMKDAVPFKVNQQLTADVAAVQAGTTQWVAGGGLDFPEDQINALYRLANGAISFRASSTRVIAMFGDAPSHDPSGGYTLDDAIAALQAARVRVIAVNSSGLDSKKQATALVNATGGALINNVSSAGVPQALLDGLRGIKVTVSPTVTSCAPELSVSTTPIGSATVAGGQVASFTETITVSPSAGPGNYTCVVDYLVDGVSLGYTQTSTIRVLGLSINDVTVQEPTLLNVGSAVFTVTLNAASTAPVTVNYATAAGTATTADFTPVSGTLTFAPGETTKTIAVPVLPDLLDEPTETFQVVLSAATGAGIVKATGTATIADANRNGSYSCQATAAKLVILNAVGVTAALANSANDPCAEETKTLINASLPNGILTVITGDVDATTDLIPDNQQSAPAAGDGARSTANVSSTTISLLGVANIQVGAVTATAGFTCTAGAGGVLSPVFSASSNVASLRVNGLTVAVGSGTLVIPLVVGQLRINATTTVNGEYTRQAFALDTALGTVVLGEAKVGVKGTALNSTGNPCVA
ncbi:Calx-beta domain-containing protein [Actinokineospora diospyrosa]|uniref:von Willebrand factor type A domain-containing protein n=1 Tax=Actinokineospora diospyrosa TaxID=103728 RepID=A0ABT1IAA2_9PSEU|nr:Calx-beta domain-containing protein [Actinokineospora diospyrosa]MCP2269573.1 von Willebrand factor type A domain-containing protein [Actinokineospora diospyrosa]